MRPHHPQVRSTWTSARPSKPISRHAPHGAYKRHRKHEHPFVISGPLLAQGLRVCAMARPVAYPKQGAYACAMVRVQGTLAPPGTCPYSNATPPRRLAWPGPHLVKFVMTTRALLRINAARRRPSARGLRAIAEGDAPLRAGWCQRLRPPRGSYDCKRVNAGVPPSGAQPICNLLTARHEPQRQLADLQWRA